MVQPDAGYMVSAYPERSIVINSYDEFSNIDVLSFIRKNKKILEQPEHYIGSWYDRTTGEVHLGVSMCIYSLTIAMKLAKDYNQQALWDVRGRRAIKCNK